jgi:hypothetical protein
VALLRRLLHLDVALLRCGISQQSLASETSSLRQIDEGRSDVATPKEPQRDIMADLAALQAEVDALRAGAGHG